MEQLPCEVLHNKRKEGGSQELREGRKGGREGGREEKREGKRRKEGKKEGRESLWPDKLEKQFTALKIYPLFKISSSH